MKRKAKATKKPAKRQAAPTDAEKMAEWAKPDPLDVLRRLFVEFNEANEPEDIWDEHYEEHRQELLPLLRDVKALLPDMDIPEPGPDDGDEPEEVTS